MNFTFRFVLEKSFLLHFCGRPVTHWSTNVVPTRPATGAGRPYRGFHLCQLDLNQFITLSYLLHRPAHVVLCVRHSDAMCSRA